MEKKYLISALKDGEVFYYKDVETAAAVEELKTKVTNETEAFKAVDDRVTGDITQIKTHSLEVDAKLEELENKIYLASKKNEFFEVVSYPKNTLVDYNCKEIRIMIPANTEFYTQNSAEIADKNSFYIGFKAYAPEGAVYFKEDLTTEYEENIKDEVFYDFSGDYSGVDSHGRKYSIVWLPVAAKGENNTWSYHGARSTNKKFIGWYYSVEWYNESKEMIKAETVRLNLANENCYRYIEPSYKYSIWDKCDGTQYVIVKFVGRMVSKEVDPIVRKYLNEFNDETTIPQLSAELTEYFQSLQDDEIISFFEVDCKRSEVAETQIEVNYTFKVNFDGENVSVRKLF